MADTSDFRNGFTMVIDGTIFSIAEFQHVKPGKGGAFVRTKLKDILSGKIIDETFNARYKIEFIRVEAKEMQFLYEDGNFHVFMDNDTYDQLNVSSDFIGDKKYFLQGGMKVDLLFDSDEVLDIRLPSHVVLKVTQTEPGLKGNTATGTTKPATVETGLTINVPLFISEGDKLRIDTRTGEYVERAKQ